MSHKTECKVTTFSVNSQIKFYFYYFQRFIKQYCGVAKWRQESGLSHVTGGNGNGRGAARGRFIVFLLHNIGPLSHM